MDSRPPLTLSPFRAMRFDPAVVGDLAEVTSPPYDVMDRHMIDTLLRQHPRNIVRLILPRLVCDPLTGEDPYQRAASRLSKWQAKGALRIDDQPAIYVYEYCENGWRVCGLIGAIGLEPPEAAVVLPHEDVIEPIVEDRLAMMAQTKTNLEPILLVYDGAGETAELIASARAQEPAIAIDAPDGTSHRLWQITDPGQLATISVSLAPHQALIADGHHRYAAYLRLQAEGDGAAQSDGPWDRGLALLVDQSQWPLQLAAIHRTDPELTLADLTAVDGLSLSDAEPVAVDVAPQDLEPTSAGEIVFTDGRYLRRLRRLDTEATVSDAQVLHDSVLAQWKVDERRLGYHHTADQAIEAVLEDGGIAMLLHPATVAQVMAVARAGKVMPRKSTSFGPKPRTGLVMRQFAND